ncbi:hypothetical protein P6144_10760 [Sphingomonas sp. HITSZ_GF]|uniref:hypothetical protein n=1 Tax=Sphingomonas sp. HITSZ_GF TaxID=3037247 RepID=UPI00240E8153|nr:hypothetical protein [Sphingomonas sp. HITSZ_GF]MDG2534130.1 hypothetical protein [Sphingomonas sp. HITSZ_GF]
MKKFVAAASGAALLLALPAQAGMPQASQTSQEAGADSGAAAAECKPKKKKKGLGLGRVLRVARDSGVVSSAASRIAGSNYVASAAMVAAVDANATPAGAAQQSETTREATC